MSPEEVIAQFLQIEDLWTDERLAMLEAHNDDGQLSYFSCCCLIGVLTADHALRSEKDCPGMHIHAARLIPGARAAEYAYCCLPRGEFDYEKRNWLRRELLRPLIRAEVERRAQVRAKAQQATAQKEMVAVTSSRQSRR